MHLTPSLIMIKVPILSRHFVEVASEICKSESIQYDIGLIRGATDNFSDANRLGQGGFGVVYKVKIINPFVVSMTVI